MSAVAFTAFVTLAYSILVTFKVVIVEFKSLRRAFLLLIEDACHMNISIASTPKARRKIPAVCDALPPPAAIRKIRVAAKRTISR